TFYETGLGACGKTNHDSDLIAAVSHTLFDEYPGYNGANPNHNPICGKKIKATYKGKSVTVKVVDRCVGCATWDLDFSPSAFTKLASKSVGRLSGVKWEFD
ncbi:plant expansin, partial [Trametopsis cervina]